MVVITLSSCPKKLKGDLTRWLFEIDTGVYVGNLSARVRDGIWERICENIGNGRATMAYNTNNEQKLEFKIHGSKWQSVDYDGIKLVKRVFTDNSDKVDKEKSKATVNHITRLEQMKKTKNNDNDYTVIDIETTGIRESDQIIEIAALRIRDSKIIDSFSKLVKCDCEIPNEISKLTGITNSKLDSEGVELEKVIHDFIDFCDDDKLIGHNISFDIRYLNKAFIKFGYGSIKNKFTDTMRTARKKTDISGGYSLKAVCEYFGIEVTEHHRALKDCELTYGIFEKLKEI